MARKRRKASAEGERASDVISRALRGRFGDEVATTRGSERESLIADWISTQSFPLDLAIGRAGIPCGRLTVIQGKEGSGKTTVVTHIMAECQRRGGLTVYLDAEYAFDSERAARMGLYDEDTLPEGSDMLPLVIVHPEHVEDALAEVEDVINSVRKDDEDILTAIVWDSVAGTPTKDELEGDFDAASPGIHARRISKGLRKLVKLVAHERIALIFVNQIKEVIGNFGFGGPQTTAMAARPLGFHATVRIDTIQIGTVGKKKQSSGIKCLSKITKNKVAPPFREAEFIIDYNYGIDDEASRLMLARDLGILKKRGGYLEFEGQTFRANAVPDDVREAFNIRLEEEARSRLAIPPRGGEVDADDADDEDEDED